MLKVHPLAELAPRDIVARAIHAEIAAGRGAFLDCREAIGAEIAEKFPTVYAIAATPASTRSGADPDRAGRALSHGRRPHRRRRPLDARRPLGLRRDRVDRRARRQPACLEFAAGGRRLRRPHRRLPSPQSGWTDRKEAGKEASNEDESALRDELRRAMTDMVGVIRSREGLVQGLGTIASLEARSASMQMSNRLTAARLIAVAAIRREESRGAHARADYPFANPVLAKRSFLRLADVEAEAEELVERPVLRQAALAV
jgi:L-aspartate oxidase